MQTFFFATTSLNFGNIFSSESISPESFYAKRGFGFDYFYNLFPQIKDYIVLFEQFPFYELAKSNETESYKIVLELELSALLLVEIKEKNIWLCPNTIFLSLETLKKIHFFSKDEQLRVIAKSESSKSLKTLNKYQDLFDFTSHSNVNKFAYSFDITINQQISSINEYIGRDKLFNTFKGFIYGFLGGQVSKKNLSEIAYIKSLQEIKNNFALLKNSMAHTPYNSSYNNKKSYGYTDNNSGNDVMRNLRFSIDESEKLFKISIDNFKETDYKTNYLKEVVLKSFGGFIDENVLNSIRHFAKFMRGIDANLEREARAWFWEANPENPFILYQTIRYSIQSYKETKNKEKQDDYDSDISKAIFKLERYVEKIFLEKAQNTQTLDLDCFALVGGQEPIKISEPTLSKHFESILNIVFLNAKQTKGKVTDIQLLPIIEKTGDLFAEGKGQTSNLYKYVTRQETTYTEKPDTPIVVKNFTSFIFNPNEIEKLQKYIEDKQINDAHYAFAFYGAFNGFASLSKDFTKAMFQNKELQSGMDKYFGIILQRIDKIPVFFRTEEPVLLKEHDSPSYETIVTQTEKLYNEKVELERFLESQEIEKIDLEEVKAIILSNAKLDKIKINDELLQAIDNSLFEINQGIDWFKIPYDAQKEYTKGQLRILLRDKFKVAKFGEKSINKLCSGIT